MNSSKQYKPSDLLEKKLQEFVDKILELDNNARINVATTNRDLLIEVVSPKFRQVTNYFVWDNYQAKTVEGFYAGGQRI